jgi:hypothetical protein
MSNAVLLQIEDPHHMLILNDRTVDKLPALKQTCINMHRLVLHVSRQDNRFRMLRALCENQPIVVEHDGA